MCLTNVDLPAPVDPVMKRWNIFVRKNEMRSRASVVGDTVVSEFLSVVVLVVQFLLDQLDLDAVNDRSREFGLVDSERRPLGLQALVDYRDTGSAQVMAVLSLAEVLEGDAFHFCCHRAVGVLDKVKLGRHTHEPLDFLVLLLEFESTEFGEAVAERPEVCLGLVVEDDLRIQEGLERFVRAEEEGAVSLDVDESIVTHHLSDVLDLHQVLRLQDQSVVFVHDHLRVRKSQAPDDRRESIDGRLS